MTYTLFFIPDYQFQKYFYVSLGNIFYCFLWRALSCGDPWATAQFASPLNPALLRRSRRLCPCRHHRASVHNFTVRRRPWEPLIVACLPVRHPRYSRCYRLPSLITLADRPSRSLRHTSPSRGPKIFSRRVARRAS